jgi:putative transposase
MFYKEPLQPGCMYHIFNRTNNKEDLFKAPENYLLFLKLCKKYIVPVADIHCYCLLPNHFHLLLHTKKDTASKIITQAFSNCFNAYTKSINKAYNRTGSLFQERFGRKYIDDESYYTSVIFYIHSNPQKHRLMKDFTVYPYSSYKSLLSDKPTMLMREQVISWFGNREQFEKFHLGNRAALEGYLAQLDI